MDSCRGVSPYALIKLCGRAYFGLLAFLALLLSAFPLSAAEKDADKVRTFVSILPQAYFVERVGGDRVTVDVLVGPGQSPHVYEPTPKQIAKLAEAQVFFRIGTPFEDALIAKIIAANRDLKVVDTRKGIRLRMETEHHDEGEQAAREGGGHAHPAGEPDPHIWLDPRLVKIQAETIREALAGIDPAHAGSYEENLKAFQCDLDELDARISRTLAPFKGRSFLVFHPAFGYFADAYGLRQVAIEIEGKEPGARHLAALVDQAKREGVKGVFVEPQFSQATAKAVADSIGATVVTIDDLARDYLRNMEDAAAKVAKALGP